MVAGTRNRGRRKKWIEGGTQRKAELVFCTSWEKVVCISRYRKTASNQDLLYAAEFRPLSGCSQPSVEEERKRMMSLGEHSDVAIISAHRGRNKRLHTVLVNIYPGRYLPSPVWSAYEPSCRHMYTGWSSRAIDHFSPCFASHLWNNHSRHVTNAGREPHRIFHPCIGDHEMFTVIL